MAEERDWRQDVLRGVNAPITPGNLRAMELWARQEGASSGDRYNWLNTTLGSQYPAINSHGVRAYPDYQTGIDHTTRTLLGKGRYNDIVSGLQQGVDDPVEFFKRAQRGFNTWGTGSGALVNLALRTGQGLPKDEAPVTTPTTAFTPSGLTGLAQRLMQTFGPKAAPDNTGYFDKERARAAGDFEAAQQELYGRRAPTPRWDAIDAPEASVGAEQRLQNVLATRPEEYSQGPKYSGWRGLLGQLGADIASAVSGNDKYSTRTATQIAMDEEQARQEGIQKRLETLQYVSQNLQRAQQRFDAAENYVRSTEMAERQAKVQGEMLQLQAELGLQSDLAKEVMQGEGNLQVALANLGVLQTEDGQYTQVGPRKGVRDEKGRLPSFAEVQKPINDLIQMVLDPKSKKMDQGAVTMAKTRAVNLLGGFYQGDDVYGPLQRLESHAAAVGAYLGVSDPKQIEEATRSLHQSGVMTEVSFARQEGKETVPGVVDFALRRGWITPEVAFGIPEWQGREEAGKKFKELVDNPPKEETTGWMDATGGSKGNAAKAEATPAAQPKPEAKPKEGGERYQQESEEQRMRSRLALERKGPPKAPDLSQMSYTSQLNAEVKHTEEMLQYYTQLYQAGAPLDEKKVAELRTELRKLRKEQDSYERAQRKDRAIPPGNKQ